MGEILVNGARRELAARTPLPALLEEMGFPVRWVVVERNGEPVAREELGATIIEPGDRLEVATPMAGG